MRYAAIDPLAYASPSNPDEQWRPTVNDQDRAEIALMHQYADADLTDAEWERLCREAAPLPAAHAAPGVRRRAQPAELTAGLLDWSVRGPALWLAQRVWGSRGIDREVGLPSGATARLRHGRALRSAHYDRLDRWLIDHGYTEEQS